MTCFSGFQALFRLLTGRLQPPSAARQPPHRPLSLGLCDPKTSHGICRAGRALIFSTFSFPIFPTTSILATSPHPQLAIFLLQEKPEPSAARIALVLLAAAILLYAASCSMILPAPARARIAAIQHTLLPQQSQFSTSLPTMAPNKHAVDFLDFVNASPSRKPASCNVTFRPPLHLLIPWLCSLPRRRHGPRSLRKGRLPADPRKGLVGIHRQARR